MDELMCVWLRASVCVPVTFIYTGFVPAGRNIRREEGRLVLEIISVLLTTHMADFVTY